MGQPTVDDAGLDAARAAHHQIGNSLQSIARLLTRERAGVSPEAAAVLSEASRRVGVLMRLHQRLQATGDDFVRLDDLLGDVCHDVADLDAADRKADVRFHGHPLYARAKTASALALITAEWVGNALEHGLARRDGAVEITLEPATVGARLIVSDDGEGAENWAAGVGQSLIDRLARQLNGRIARKSDGSGTRLELTCPDVFSHPVRLPPP